MNTFPNNGRPPNEREVNIDTARTMWPRAFEIASDALGVMPARATTAIMDQRLILFLWGPSFDLQGESGEIGGAAAITDPMSDGELVELMLAREVAH